MGNVQRICEKCGAGGPLEARYCPNCGHDNQLPEGQAELPIPAKNLPMLIGKAALPLLAGAASLLVRAGWRLLQDRLAHTTPEEAASVLRKMANAESTQSLAKRQTDAPVQKKRRTVHIRSSWAVGDAHGNWQRGSSEHTIEFDE